MFQAMYIFIFACMHKLRILERMCNHRSKQLVIIVRNFEERRGWDQVNLFVLGTLPGSRRFPCPAMHACMVRIPGII